MAQILVVEDDPWIADCIVRWLRADMHTVHHCVDAQAALDTLDQILPHVIVLDLFLPGANGVQLLHMLRSYPDLAQVPIVLCSNALPQHMPDVRAYGVRAVLDKARLSRRQLNAAIQGALQHATF